MLPLSHFPRTWGEVDTRWLPLTPRPWESGSRATALHSLTASRLPPLALNSFPPNLQIYHVMEDLHG